MAFAFLLSGLLILGLVAFLLIAPPAMHMDTVVLLSALGCTLIALAFLTKGPGRHRR